MRGREGEGRVGRGWQQGLGEQHQGRAETAPLSTADPLQGQEDHSLTCCKFPS